MIIQPFSFVVEELIDLRLSFGNGKGFTLLYKRFEKGRMQWPRTTKEAKLITSKQFEDLLSGIQIEPPNHIVKIPKVAILGLW